MPVMLSYRRFIFSIAALDVPRSFENLNASLLFYNPFIRAEKRPKKCHKPKGL